MVIYLQTLTDFEASSRADGSWKNQAKLEMLIERKWLISRKRTIKDLQLRSDGKIKLNVYISAKRKCQEIGY